MNRTFSGRLASAAVFLLLVAGAVFTLFPIYMAVLNSLKTQGQMLTNILAFPSRPVVGNYVQAFADVQFVRSFLNTVVVAVVGLAGMVTFASMAGYKLSRTHSRLSRFLFGLFVMSMLIPFHSIMITLTKIAKSTGIQGSTVGLGMIYIGLGVPMAVFLYHGFVKSVPRELDEAAIIDGSGELRRFFWIIFPLLKPITTTIAILNLLWIWNDFLLPLLMLTDPDHYTLLISINMLFGQYGNNDWSGILASLVMGILPVILLFLFLQKHILKGVADGAVKI